MYDKTASHTIEFKMEDTVFSRTIAQDTGCIFFIIKNHSLSAQELEEWSLKALAPLRSQRPVSCYRKQPILDDKVDHGVDVLVARVEEHVRRLAWRRLTRRRRQHCVGVVVVAHTDRAVLADAIAHLSRVDPHG